MSDSLRVGDLAPDFTLPSTEGTIILSKRLEKNPVLLVFYPGDGTKVCTTQLCNYRDNLDVFRSLGVEILAINPQSLKSHETFAKENRFPFPLLSDSDRSVCRAYGAVGFLGIIKRSLVLVDQDRRIRYLKNDLVIFYESAEAIQKVLRELDLR